ncbi:MAG: carbonic anhydrase [Bdellovibrio sp.]|nr:carbonic anhydrase [Bdellovibrio sp.]
MKKLLNGIVEFRKNTQPEYREKFAKLALGQSPDTLFVACSDSRVVPNVFASTDPGDLFVVRNVGNLIPLCGEGGHSTADESEAAALEFALLKLDVSHIVICGHSECGAMHAIHHGREKVGPPNLRSWLRHGDSRKKVDLINSLGLDPVNFRSQTNVLEQLEHLKSYPFLAERIAQNRTKVHGWWFELKTANVYAYEEAEKRFILIDEEEAQRIRERLS